MTMYKKDRRRQDHAAREGQELDGRPTPTHATQWRRRLLRRAPHTSPGRTRSGAEGYPPGNIQAHTGAPHTPCPEAGSGPGSNPGAEGRFAGRGTRGRYPSSARCRLRTSGPAPGSPAERYTEARNTEGRSAEARGVEARGVEACNAQACNAQAPTHGLATTLR